MQHTSTIINKLKYEVKLDDVHLSYILLIDAVGNNRDDDVEAVGSTT